MPARIAKANISCRQGVFETNSSSMHSLVILKDSNTTMPKATDWKTEENEDGTYTILVGANDFGRAPFAFFSHPIDKFLYLLASEYSVYSDDDEGRNAFVAAMVKRLDGCSGIKFTELDWQGRVDYGDVDHQSAHEVWNCIASQDIDPFDFIFDVKSIIIIDGDEYGEWDNMKESGLINEGNISYDMSRDYQEDDEFELDID